MSKTAELLKDYRRATKAAPCPICEHPDWCMVSRDGLTAICQRVESSVRRGQAGFLHRLSDPKPVYAPVPRVSKPVLVSDWGREAGIGVSGVSQEDADRLGVSLDSLCQLDAGRMMNGLRFPMRDERGAIIGIRTRTWDGAKKAVYGSQNGLFIPAPLLPENVTDSRAEWLFIVEGPTSCAALLTMGLSAIGRAGNVHCVDMCKRLAQVLRPVNLCLLADRDKPGSDGERNTQRGVREMARAIPRLLVGRPPVGFKDARDWILAGGNAAEVKAVFN